MEMDATEMDGISRGTGDKVGLIEETPRSNSKSTDSDSTRNESSPLHQGTMAPPAAKPTLQSYSLRVIIVSTIVFAIAVTVSLILTIYLAPPQIGAHGAVASDVGICSEAGLAILKKGGNAVDAAVTTCLCVGVVHAQSSGIGGGGFMLVHDHKTQRSSAYDFREVSPKEVSEEMFKSELSRTQGGLSIAVPGEIKGLEKAHMEYGRLKWKDVVSPVSHIARTGFNCTVELARTLSKFQVAQFHGKLQDIFVKNGEFVKAGDFIRRPDLANTLDAIAEQGSLVFYKGPIADTIVKAVSDIGGKLTRDDLKNYRVMTRKVIKTTFKGRVVETFPAPTAGPVLLLILNIMGKFNWTKNSMNESLSYHRMIESFKYGFAHLGYLGDPGAEEAVVNNTQKIISENYAELLNAQIENVTYPSEHYGQLFFPLEHKGTSHLSVVDSSELMVSLTTTVNHEFGSRVMTDSGILLNNEMADFSFRDSLQKYGIPANKNNFIKAGMAKRPLSAMVPTVVYNKDSPCSIRTALGGSNGMRIITGVAETIFNILLFGMKSDLAGAIEKPRLHDQLYPSGTEYEDGFPENIVKALEEFGHNMTKVTDPLSIVQGVLKMKDDVFAHSDSRKYGKAAKF